MHVCRFWLHMALLYHLQPHLQQQLPQKLLQHLLHSLLKVLQLQLHHWQASASLYLCMTCLTCSQESACTSSRQFVLHCTHAPSSIKIKSALPTQLEPDTACMHVSYQLESSYEPLANIDMWYAQVRQQDRLLKLLQDPQLMLLLLLLLQHLKWKATALILSSWLLCHQRFRPKSWSSRDESGVCESGNDSNSKQLLQRHRSASSLVCKDVSCTRYFTTSWWCLCAWHLCIARSK